MIAASQQSYFSCSWCYWHSLCARQFSEDIGSGLGLLTCHVHVVWFSVVIVSGWILSVLEEWNIRFISTQLPLVKNRILVFVTGELQGHFMGHIRSWATHFQSCRRLLRLLTSIAQLASNVPDISVGQLHFEQNEAPSPWVLLGCHSIVREVLHSWGWTVAGWLVAMATLDVSAMKLLQGPSKQYCITEHEQIAHYNFGDICWVRCGTHLHRPDLVLLR